VFQQGKTRRPDAYPGQAAIGRNHPRIVKQHAKLTRSPGETASKFDHLRLCHTPPFGRGSS